MITRNRQHIAVNSSSAFERGAQRGRALKATLLETYRAYSELFRVIGVSEETEEAACNQLVEVLNGWRPELVDEMNGVAQGSGVALQNVVALNARTELIALGKYGARECSTVTAKLPDGIHGVQTWDWHIELDNCWHTHEVSGNKYRFVGLTEQGILAKIGINDQGLAVHFNILGHKDDGATGVPMHLLAYLVLSECATVREAIEFVRNAPIGSSSSLTILDSSEAVSLEITPHDVYIVESENGTVQRTNHFQFDEPLRYQKHELYEPDSTERLELLRDRLNARLPQSETDLLELMVTDANQPPITCVPDMSKERGERWATLATTLTYPSARMIKIFAGMPPEALKASENEWITLEA